MRTAVPHPPGVENHARVLTSRPDGVTADQDGRGADRILTRGAGDHTSADPRRIPITIVGRSSRPEEELRVVRQYGPFGAFGVRSPDSIE